MHTSMCSYVYVVTPEASRSEAISVRIHEGPYGLPGSCSRTLGASVQGIHCLIQTLFLNNNGSSGWNAGDRSYGSHGWNRRNIRDREENLFYKVAFMEEPTRDQSVFAAVAGFGPY